MKKHKLCSSRPALVVLGWIVTQSFAFAADQSAIVSVSGSYDARDVAVGQSISGGYSVANGMVYSWSNDFMGYVGYQKGNIATGEITTIGHPSFPINSNGYGDAFGLYDAANGYFYAGTYNDAGSGMYRYNEANGQWTSLGVFESIYGAAVHDGKVYASGLNAIWSGGVGQGNQIALYDLTGGNSHDVLIQATGNSAYVAVDAQGNVYYANYNGTTPALYRWSFEDINSVRADMGGGVSGGGVGDTYLTYDDAQILTFLPDGANGVAVDDGGNVFVSVNGSSSSLLMWNSSMGYGNQADPFHYTNIAGPDGGFGWFGAIATSGDFLNGGKVYLSNFGSSGIAEISQVAVPEPSTLALSVLAILGGMAAYRRRASLRIG